VGAAGDRQPLHATAAARQMRGQAPGHAGLALGVPEWSVVTDKSASACA
jgi:hypothetical protein